MPSVLKETMKKKKKKSETMNAAHWFRNATFPGPPQAES